MECSLSPALFYVPYIKCQGIKPHQTFVEPSSQPDQSVLVNLCNHETYAALSAFFSGKLPLAIPCSGVATVWIMRTATLATNNKTQKDNRISFPAVS